MQARSARSSEIAKQANTYFFAALSSFFTYLPQTDFERLTPYIRDLSKKQQVTAQSLEKIEDGKVSLPSPLSNHTLKTLAFLAAYAIVVRGSEYDVPQEMLDDMVAISISTFGGGHRHKRGRKGGDNDDDEAF